MKETEDKEQNLYAKNIYGVEIFISKAESGRNGYFCIGCGGEMQARKGELRAAHFSHIPNDVTRIGKCIYRDETYRHKLAKDILQRIKQIKVPAVYKFLPRGIEGVANKIKNAETIYANTVRVELYFYEDQDGTVKYIGSDEWEEDEKKFLIIKPDVTFFDTDNKPILFIEIFATHKVDDEKLSKIRKLGINTVQVAVPKDSPAEIESTFYQTNKTKWLYNHDEATSEYIPVSSRDAAGVPPVDELQRAFFEESFKCRANQIRNLIRAIRKCLGSQLYTSFEQNLREEIQRTENNTNQNTERLRGIQATIRTEIDGRFEPENQRIRSLRETVKNRRADLERRYKQKRRELDIEANAIRDLQKRFEPTDQPEVARIEKYLEKQGFDTAAFDERKRTIRNEESEHDQLFEQQKKFLDISTSQIQRKLADIEARRSNLPREFTAKANEIRTQF